MPMRPWLVLVLVLTLPAPLAAQAGPGDTLPVRVATVTAGTGNALGWLGLQGERYWARDHASSHPVGQPALVVLAVASAVCDRVDGRASPRFDAYGALRRCAPNGWHSLLDPAATDPQHGGAPIRPGRGTGPRHQGQAFAAALRTGDWRRIHAPGNRCCPLLARRSHVAGSGSSHRARAVSCEPGPQHHAGIRLARACSHRVGRRSMRS